MTLRVDTASPTDGYGPGPHAIAVVGERTVRASVTFGGDADDVEATVVARAELTPEECAAVIAWCRSRWSAPARIRAFAISFAG
jgi:hypothetical protein